MLYQEMNKAFEDVDKILRIQMGTIKDSGVKEVMTEKQVTELIIDCEYKLKEIIKDIKNYTRLDKRHNAPLGWLISKQVLIKRIDSLKMGRLI